MGLLSWMHYQVLRAKRRRCFSLAFKLCSMDFDNESAQRHIDKAKDELYRAAHEFDEMSKRLKAGQQ